MALDSAVVRISLLAALSLDGDSIYGKSRLVEFPPLPARLSIVLSGSPGLWLSRSGHSTRISLAAWNHDWYRIR